MEPPVLNQLFAFLKNDEPVPTQTMRPSICRLRSTTGTSNAMTASEAKHKVKPSSQPRNGPAFGMNLLVNT